MPSISFQIQSHSRDEFIDITSKVAEFVQGTGIINGVCTIYVPHTTAGVTINENADPSVVRDVFAHLRKLVPEHDGFTHGEGNSDSHIKASMMGASVSVPVVDGRMALGTWQGIYFCEFDGPRRRHFTATVLGDAS